MTDGHAAGSQPTDPQPTDSVIAATGLTKRFGKITAIDGLHLMVPRGASIGILGAAGSGKSTLVRLLAGLFRPSAGTLTVGGAPAGSIAARRRLGVVLQDGQLHGWMTAREALAFAADLARVPGSELASRVDDVAGRMSITTALDRRVSELTVPERGRLRIAQALVGTPDMVVLDEPFQPLDVKGRLDAVRVLSALRGPTTIALASQHVADIEAVCDRLVLLDAGRLVLDTSVPELARRLPLAFVIETGAAGSLAFAGLVARLRAEPWVADVAVAGGRLTVLASDEARASRELLPAVVGTGLPVSVFRREPRSIEALLSGLPRP